MPKIPVDKLFLTATGKPIYDFQKEAIAAFNTKDKVLIVKSRRIGITYLGAFYAVWEALKGKKTLAIFPSLRQSLKYMEYVNGFLDRILAKIPASKDFITKNTKTELGFKNGGEITALPNSPQTVRGFEANTIWIDEMAHFPNVSDIWSALLPSISRGGKIILISTPRGQAGMFYDKYNEYKVDKSAVVLEYPHTCCADLKLDEIRKDLDTETFRQEYCCEFLSEADTYFPYDLVDRCAREESEPADPDAKPEITFGIDIGRKRDFTSITGITRSVETDDTGATKETFKVVFHELLKNMPYEDQLSYIETEVFDKFEKKNLQQVLIDQIGIGNMITEMLQNRHSSTLTPFTLNKENKNEMMTFLKKQFEDETIIIPKTDSLIKSLHSVKRKNTATGVIYDADRDDESGHADEAMSLALALYGFKSGGEPQLLDLDFSKVAHITPGYSDSSMGSMGSG